jgi:N-acetyl-anhydromuramoyl-L-alanine amidase
VHRANASPDNNNGPLPKHRSRINDVRSPRVQDIIVPTKTRLHVDRAGVVRAIAQVPSPNCDARPAGEQITLLVIHGISLPPGQFGGPWVVELFTNRLKTTAHPYFAHLADLRVSSHFFIRREGVIAQFVPCEMRAWHAGASEWRGRQRCNDFSIGVELEGTDDRPYESIQYVMLARLTRALRRRYPLRDIAGHCQIAPGRKTDPGPSFDWPRFRRMTAPRIA